MGWVNQSYWVEWFDTIFRGLSVGQTVTTVSADKRNAPSRLGRLTPAQTCLPFGPRGDGQVVASSRTPD